MKKARATDFLLLTHGFQFTDRMRGSYRIGFGHINSPNSPVGTANPDGSYYKEVLPERSSSDRSPRHTAFSPNGQFFIIATEEVCKFDLRTGNRTVIEELSLHRPFDDCSNIDIAPDGREVLFTLTKRFEGDSMPVMSSRLVICDLENRTARTIYEDSGDRRLERAYCCWINRRAVLTSGFADSVGGEFWHVEFDSGRATRLAENPNHSGWLQGDLSPDGDRFVTWDWDHKGIRVFDFKNGTMNCLTNSGYATAWSPDGRQIAFLEDQHTLCVGTFKEHTFRRLVWFKDEGLSLKQRQFSYGVTPCWSPDGTMLWFALASTWRPHPPTSLKEALAEAGRYIEPILHRLDPRKGGIHFGYSPHPTMLLSGIVDLVHKSVFVSNRYGYGVEWIPA